MAQVPLTSKILAVASTTDTTEKKSALANSSAEYYTMQDVIDTAAQNKGYLSYIASLSQTGTDAPTATVLVNELGGEVVWTRDSQGVYTATLEGAFDGYVVINTPVDTYGANGLVNNEYSAAKLSSDAVYLHTAEVTVSTGAKSFEDGCLFDGYSFIEMKVFPA